MTVGLVQIKMLKLGRRRQQIVGIVGRVRLEMLKYDREQIVAAKAGDDFF